MSLYKRGGVWWVDFTTPRGRRIRKATDVQVGTAADRKAAQELHDKWKHEAWMVERMGERPQHTWEEAAVRFLQEKQQNGKKTVREDARFIKFVTPYIGGKTLSEINEDDIAKVRAAKLAERNRYGHPITNATVNRHMALLRTLFNMALKEWKWIDRTPFWKQLRESRMRLVSVKPEKIRELLDRLPEHSRDMAVFALSTGLRQVNVKGLKWSMVDMDNKIATIDSADLKGNVKSLGVPLGPAAMEVLTKQIGKHEEYVFTYKGKPIRNVNAGAWQKALADVGLKGMRWHDIRHLWASWLIQKTGNTRMVQEMGGWSDERMVRRYAHLYVDHLRPGAELVSALVQQVVLGEAK